MDKSTLKRTGILAEYPYSYVDFCEIYTEIIINYVQHLTRTANAKWNICKDVLVEAISLGNPINRTLLTCNSNLLSHRSNFVASNLERA